MPSHIPVYINDGVRSRLLESSFKNVEFLWGGGGEEAGKDNTFVSGVKQASTKLCNTMAS